MRFWLSLQNQSNALLFWKLGRAMSSVEVPHTCQPQEKRNFSNHFSLKGEVITTQEYLRSTGAFKETGKRWRAKGESISWSIFFFTYLLKRGKKRRLTQLSLTKWLTAPAIDKAAISMLTLVDQEKNNYLYTLYISWSAKQKTESSEHLSPREDMIKKTTALGSASFCILFQTPCCTSKCHYGLCYIAAEMRMWSLEQEKGKKEKPNNDWVWFCHTSTWSQ